MTATNTDPEGPAGSITYNNCFGTLVGEIFNTTGTRFRCVDYTGNVIQVFSSTNVDYGGAVGYSCSNGTCPTNTLIPLTPTPTQTPSQTPTNTVTPTQTNTPSQTLPAGYSIDWSFSQQAQGGDFSVSVNGIQVVYTTVGNSGTITVSPGDYVSTSVGAGAQSPLTAEACLTVNDGATTLYNNCTQGYPSAGESYGAYYPSDNGSIQASSYEF
jgi:hypothetical protein